MGSRRIPWLTLAYLVAGGGLVVAAFLFHLKPPMLQLAVAVTLPWSLGHGLFVWSAIHGLVHELAIYLSACLGLNTVILFFVEKWWRLRRGSRVE